MQPKNEEDFKKLIDLAPHVVYTISSRGTITSLNPSFEKITGWKVKDWLGKHFSELICPDDLTLALKYFRKTMRGRVNEAHQIRILAKNGKYLVLEVTSSPQKKNGKVVGQIGVAWDITDYKEIQKNGQHFEDLIKSADSAIISRDIEGKILSWNPSAEKLFGYKAQEIIGRDVFILVPKDEEKELEKVIKKIKRGRVIEDYEAIRIRKDGKLIPILAKLSPIRDARGKITGLSAFMHDNTKKRRNEREKSFLAETTRILSESLNYVSNLKKLAKIIVPEISDCCVIYTLEKGETLRITQNHFNSKMMPLFMQLLNRYSARQDLILGSKKVIETGKSEFYPHIDPKMIKKYIRDKEFRELIPKINPTSAMMVPIISRKKVLGAIAFVLTSGNRVFDLKSLRFAEELGVKVGLAVDNAMHYYEAQKEIEKRKKIEIRLRQSWNQLRVTLKNVADGITLIDSRGKIIYVNDAAAAIFEYKSTQAMIVNPSKWSEKFEIRDEEGNHLHLSRIPERRALNGEIDPEEFIKATNKKNGEEKHLIIKARPILSESGNVRAVVNIIHDITQRLELERNKEDFISVASHELKTPVTSIKGYLHLLKKDFEGKDGKVFDFLSKMDIQVDKLRGLVQDLLDLSKIRAGKLTYKKERFEIGKLVKEVVDDLQRINKHKIVLNNGVDRKISGDKDRIGHVLTNLINNAIKYSPNSDKIIVSICQADKKNIEIKVRDFGIGVRKDEIKKIFDRFYKVRDFKDKTFPGLGIGLYLSREIILRHKGKIWVKSQRGKGSIFGFTLPIKN